MRIRTFPKDYFDSVMIQANITADNVTSQPRCFISINDTCGTDEKPYFKENTENVLVLFFDDIDNDLYIKNDTNGKEMWHRAMTEEQAKEIIRFIDKNKDKMECIIHCGAGVRRSGSVAKFINKYLDLPWSKFHEDNRHILPRESIIKTLESCTQKDFGIIK